MRLRSFGTIYECISFYVVETEPFVLCVLCLGQRLDQRIRNVFAALLWVFVTLSFSAGHWRASKSWWKKSGLTSATRWRTGAARAWEAPTQTREVPFSCSGSTVFIRCNKYGFCSDTFSFAQILSPLKLFSVMYFCSSYCCNFPATLSSISHSLLNWLSIHTGIPFRSTQAEFLIISTLNLSYNSSNLFGTFLTNNLSERRRMRVRERTRSIWGYLRWVVDKKGKTASIHLEISGDYYIFPIKCPLSDRILPNSGTSSLSEEKRFSGHAVR